MASPGKRIFQQIEASADSYGPGTYIELLTYYSDIRFESDSQTGSFIPLSQVQADRKNRILFAIGIIPPAVNVTGRLLDRTASVASIEGLPEAAPAAAAAATTGGGKETPTGKGHPAHKNARPILEKAFRAVMGRDPTLEELQYLQAIGWLETNYGNGWKGDMKGSNNWGAVQCPGNQQNSPDCIMHRDTKASGQSYAVAFRKYETPQKGAEDLVRNVFGKTRKTSDGLGEDGSAMKASYLMRRGSYYEGFCPKATRQYGTQVNKSLPQPDLNEATQACAEEAITTHATTAYKIMQSVAVANGDPTVLGLGTYEDADSWYREKYLGEGPTGPVAGDSADGKWKEKGAPEAEDAKAQEEKLEGSPLLNSAVGKQLLAAQKAQIQLIQLMIERMKNTPPLAMLVNPNKFSVKGEKIVQDGNWGRNGPIIEFWGDQQDKLSASGRVAGYFALDVTNANLPGLSRSARNYSAGWQNFQSLYQFYRNNGAMYLPDMTAPGEAPQNLTMLGSIYIYYDNVLYIGSFDSFNVSESDTSPFTVDYSFEFTVRASFLLDRTDDQFTYGAPALFPKDTVPTASTTPTNTPNVPNIPTPATSPTQEDQNPWDKLVADSNRSGG